MEDQHDRAFLYKDQKNEKDLLSGLQAEKSNVQKHQDVLNTTIDDLRKRLERLEKELDDRTGAESSMESSEFAIQSKSSQNVE